MSWLTTIPADAPVAAAPSCAFCRGPRASQQGMQCHMSGRTFAAKQRCDLLDLGRAQALQVIHGCRLLEPACATRHVCASGQAHSHQRFTVSASWSPFLDRFVLGTKLIATRSFRLVLQRIFQRLGSPGPRFQELPDLLLSLRRKSRTPPRSSPCRRSA